MLKAMKVIELKDKKNDFKLVLVLTMVLVAISFFAAGLVFANSPETTTVIKLLATIIGVNTYLVYFLLNKLNDLTQ